MYVADAYEIFWGEIKVLLNSAKKFGFFCLEGERVLFVAG
jgi:hypothetical protein